MKPQAIIKFRNAWLGIAMLCVMWYHTDFEYSIAVLEFLRKLVYGSIDIVIFASGLGCYYSLSKNDDILAFDKRRFARFFPTYWVFLFFWFIFKLLSDGITYTAVIGNILGVQKLTTQPHVFNWYVSAILLFYILAPHFKKFVDGVESKAKQVLIVVILILLSVPFWGANTFTVIVTRLPIYYIGMLFGKRCISGKKFTKKEFAVYGAGAVVGGIMLFVFVLFFEKYLWSHGLYWYPYIFVTPFLCVLISYIMNFFVKYKPLAWIEKFFALVGKYSLEVYFMHILIFHSAKYMMKIGMFEKSNLVYYICILLTPLGCVGLNLLTKGVLKVCGKIKTLTTSNKSKA